MIISIEKKTFTDAVHTVARFADRKSATLPVLSTILILAGDEGIKMRATRRVLIINLKEPVPPKESLQFPPLSSNR